MPYANPKLHRKAARRKGKAPWLKPAWGRQPSDIAYGLCHCGCGRKTNPCTETNSRRNFVKGEPHRFLRGHQFRRSTVDYLEEDRGHDTSCWIWQRCINESAGRPVVMHPASKKLCYAHCLYYEQHVGPVPEGMELDHLCKQRDCIRPDHLEPVTHTVNCRRAQHVRLSEEGAAMIRLLRKIWGLTELNLANLFGLSKSTVKHVLRDRSWRD